MPTETFLNLSPLKQEKFLKASKKVFSNHLFQDVKITEIVLEASIARGSFYAYFESKEALYTYLLSKYQEDFINLLKTELSKNNGHLVEAFIKIFDQVVLDIQKEDERKFLLKVFSNMNLYREHCLAKKRPFDKNSMLWKDILSIIDTSTYNNIAKELVNEVLFYMLTSLTHGIIPILLENEDMEKCKQVFLNKMTLIEQGLYKNKEDMNENII